MATVPVVLVAILVVLSGYAVADKSPSEEGAHIPAGASSLFPANEGPDDTARQSERKPVELGLRFTASTDGHILGLEMFRADGDAAPHSGKLWDDAGNIMARLTFPRRDSAGWQYESFATPVEISANREYIASYHTRSGYAAEAGYFDDQPMTRGHLSTAPSPNDNGSLYAYGWRSRLPSSSYLSTNYWVDPVYVPVPGSPSAQPTPIPAPSPSPTPEPTQPPNPSPSPTPPPSSSPTPAPPPGVNPPSPDPGGFPGASNTGVPAGVSLANYTGPMRITQPGTIIDAKLIRGTLIIEAPNVTISRSKIIGTIVNYANSAGYSFTISDSEVDAGNRAGTGIGDVNFTATRVHVYGGNRGIHCENTCTVADSYVHGQFTDVTGTFHESGIRMGQNAVIRHNTIACDAPEVPPDAGCSADLTGYGDFAPVQNNLIESNLFKASTGSFCAYGGSSAGKPYSNQANNIRFRDNVFERGPNGRCGFYGPITDFDVTRPGNVWVGNVWDDGTPVRL